MNAWRWRLSWDRPQRCMPRRGMALLVVMVLTMMIALGAYRYSFTMQAEYRVTRVNEEQVQARLAALSGLELAAAIVEKSPLERERLGGVVFNPKLFQHVRIDAVPESSQEEDSSVTWHASLVSPRLDLADDGSGASTSNPEVGEGTPELRFGLENEAGKLHIPTLLRWDRSMPGHARATLLRLPGANAITIDSWLRGLRGVGMQSPPAAASATTGLATANGGGTQFAAELSIDQGPAVSESRLMDQLENGSAAGDQRAERDRFRMLWLGGDFNQNYRLDALEVRLAEVMQAADHSTAASAPLATIGMANDSPTLRPWQRFLSWESGQRNESAAGAPRLYLNDDNLANLHRSLLQVWPLEWANWTIALRQFGPTASGQGTSAGGPSNAASSFASSSTSSSASPAGISSSSWTPDFSLPASYRLVSVLDLVDAQVTVPATAADGTSQSSSPSGRKQTLLNPFSDEQAGSGDYIKRVLDEATVELSERLDGRVDVSDAPVEVLAGVPGVSLELAQEIVRQRSASQSLSESTRRDSLAWLLSESLVTLAQLKQIEPYLTCRSDVYSVQAVGYRDAVSPVYRCTAVIDARQRPAQIRNLQVWHAWDRGFPIQSLSNSTLVQDQ